MSTPWLKLSVDILDDHKIKKIRKLPGGNEILICWIAILCMAMRSHRPGFLFISEEVLANEEDVAVAADVSVDVAKIAIKTFLSLGMLSENDDGSIEVKKFSDHQNLHGVQFAREQSALRVKRFRDAQKQRLLGNVTNVTSNVGNGKEIKIETKKENKEKENIESGSKDPSSPLPLQEEKKVKEEEYNAQWDGAAESTWNALAPVELGKIRTMTRKRVLGLSRRVLEGMKLEEVLLKASKSDFLLGKNDRGWKMDFDWVIANDTNWVKVMEGKYDNKPSPDDQFQEMKRKQMEIYK